MQKQETWYVLKGKLVFNWIDTETAKEQTSYLEEGHVVVIPRGLPHRLKALRDSSIMEVSTEHHDHDSYRVIPGYNGADLIGEAKKNEDTDDR
jgi:quercetin dioxygenase-like cupin family protein